MARELPALTTALVSSLPAGLPLSHLGATITLLSQLEGVEQASAGCIGHFGPFQVLRALGEGGMGVALLAKDSRNDSVVAVKVLKPHLCQHPLAVQRFLGEAHHMSRLQHPHILPVLDNGQTSLGPYYTMPYCAKGSLAGELSEDQPVAAERILQVLIPVAEALTHAHARGLIHRDLKPGNILLGDEGKVYLSDFGLARTLFNELTLDVEGSHCEGTAPYLSPVVANGEAEDTRCDIYSLGAILYQMLTGHLPYAGATTEEIIAKIKAGPPRPVLELNPKAPTELVLVCEAAMARDQRDRYANMADFLEDLRRIQRGQAPLGAHASAAWVNRAKLAWRRHWPKIAWAACAVAAGIGLWQTGWLSPPVLTQAYEVYLGEGYDYFQAAMGNLNGDRFTDFVLDNPEAKTIQVVDVASASIVKFRYEDFLVAGENAPGTVCVVRDATDDGVDEVFLQYSWRGKARSRVLNLNKLVVGDFLYEGEYNPATASRKENSTGLNSLYWGDLDGDQNPEHLVSMSTSFGQRRPRGLCLFDAATGARRWEFPTAPYVHAVLVQDLDKDGRQEIIFGTIAAGNGKTLPDGTDDFHSHLGVLDAEGRLRWRHALATDYTSVDLLGVSGHSWAEGRVYASVFANSLPRLGLPPERRGTGVASRVVWYNAEGKLMKEFVPHHELVSAKAVDLTGDGRQVILAADTNGWLYVLSEDLQVLRQTQLESPQYMVKEITVLGNIRLPQLSREPYVALFVRNIELPNPLATGKDHREVVINHYYNIKLVVVDRFLHPVIQSTLYSSLKGYDNFLRAVVRDVDGDGQDEMVVFSNRITIYTVAKK